MRRSQQAKVLPGKWSAVKRSWTMPESRSGRPCRVRAGLGERGGEHAATQQEKEAQGADPAQAGRKYLFTIGRTKHIFGDTPNELIDGCIRAESGGPKIFNDF